MPAAGRYLYHNAPRTGGQGSLRLLFYSASAASSAAPEIERERLGIEGCLRLFPHRQNLQCRFIAGVEDTAIGDERLLDIAKRNLTKSFSVVGICETFEESLMLIA